VYREALKSGFYDLQSARDNYRVNVQDNKMHQDLILRFIEVQALLMYPITPHMSEHIWKLLKKVNVPFGSIIMNNFSFL
jgi:leucyl-tRNA synthetase